MDPYTERMLAVLGNRQALDVLESTPTRLEDIYWELKDGGLERSYGPDKWSARKIYAHFTDAEIAFGFRVRQMLSQPGHRVQTYDQDAWMSFHHGIDAPLAIETFRGMRLWNLTLYRSLSPEQLAITASHPERGEESLEVMLKLMAGHDLAHLDHLIRIAEAGDS